jgi:hypothetical protein
MPDSPSLRALQRRFHELVTAAEGVPLLVDEGRVTVSELDAMVRGDTRLAAAQRLDIYANMYFFRIRDVLRDDHPKLVALIGDDAFHNLATDFLAAHPPEHFSLRNAGRKLPRFLDGHALIEPFPFIADLARLERQRLEVFDAADAELLTMESLRARAPATFAALSLELVPAQARVSARFAVDEAWQALDEGQPLPSLPPCPTELVVWRAEPMIYHRRLNSDEEALWPLLVAGVSFGVLCERLSERHPHEDVAPIAFQLLASWVEEGLLTSDGEGEAE